MSKTMFLFYIMISEFWLLEQLHLVSRVDSITMETEKLQYPRRYGGRPLLWLKVGGAGRAASRRRRRRWMWHRLPCPLMSTHMLGC